VAGDSAPGHRQADEAPGDAFAFDAGQGLSEHTVPFDALVCVCDGEAEIIIDGAAHNVSNGNAIIMPANHPHAVNAKQRFKMLLVMIRK